MLSKDRRSSYNIGVRAGYFAYSNQLVDLIDGLSNYSNIHVFLLATQEEVLDNYNWHENVFKEHEVMLIDSASAKENLKTLDFFFAHEADHELFGYIPRSVIKVGLPHGVDIPFEQTMLNYGGGYCFDYIISSIDRPKLGNLFLSNKFPEDLRNHSRSYVCDFPFGNMKLDKFISKVIDSSDDKRRIIYHVSYFDCEESWVPGIIIKVLKIILERFVEVELVFRVHLLDRKSKIVKEAVEYGRQYNNFIYSTSESYLDDYAAGAVMICHRPYHMHLFNLATGGKSIICTPDGLDVEVINTEQMYSCEISNLINTVAYELKRNSVVDVNKIKEQCLIAKINNPGESISHLVDSLDNMIYDNKIENAFYYQLNDEGLDGHNLFSIYDLTIINILSRRGSNPFFRALSDKIPNFGLAHLLKAESHACTSLMYYYFYQKSLLFYEDACEKIEKNTESRFVLHLWEQTTGRRICDYLKDKEFNSGDNLSIRERRVLNKIVNIEEVDVSLPSFFSFFDLKNREWIEYSGDIDLYGCGNIANDIYSIIDSGKLDVNICQVYVSDEDKVGTQFQGYQIESRTSLYSQMKYTPIVIASLYYLIDIYIDLLNNVENDRPIYAVCFDHLTKKLVDALIADWQEIE